MGRVSIFQSVFIIQRAISSQLERYEDELLTLWRDGISIEILLQTLGDKYNIFVRYIHVCYHFKF